MITSVFGDTLVAVINEHLPYPFGQEITGYTVTNLATTLRAAMKAFATVVWGPYSGQDRDTAIVRFPGGYVAEIHDVKTH